MKPQCLKAYKNMYSDFPFNLEVHNVSRCFHLHSHDFIEFSYVIQGHGTQIINGRRNKMKPGTFSLILPYQLHEIILENGEGFTTYNCNISLEAFFEPGETSLTLNQIVLNSDEKLEEVLNLSGGQADKIKNILDEMYMEYSGNAIWKNLLLKVKLEELFLLFDRYRKSGTQESTEVMVPCVNSGVHVCHKSVSQQANIWEVIYYVYSNYKINLTLQGLAERFYLSLPYLSTRFRECTGKNFHTFLQEVRTQFACSLLISTDIPLLEVAHEVGYESYVTFFRTFRKYRGISPIEYRQRQGKTENFV